MADDLDAERSAVEGNAGRDDERDGAVLQQLFAIGDARCLRVALGKGLSQIVLGGMEADEFGAGAQEAVDMAVDLFIVDADHGDAKVGHGGLSSSGRAVGMCAEL